VVPIRLALGVALAALSYGAAGQVAGEAANDQAIQEMIDRSRAIIDQAAGKALPPGGQLTPQQRAVQQAIATAGQSQKLPLQSSVAKEDVPSTKPLPDGMVVYLMTTFPGLEATLTLFGAQVQAYARANPDRLAEVHVVIRGLLPGTRHLGDTMRALQPIVSEFQQDQDLLATPDFAPEPIQVALNPKPFREFGFGDEGPAIAIVKSDGTIVKGTGTLSIAAVLDHHDKFGTLASLGPTTPFIERDLLDEIQDRIADLDGEAIKKGAQDRLWARLSSPQVELPLADAYTRTELDLSFQLQHDLKGQDGNILVPAGTVFNPMDHMPFTRTMIVFDPSRAEEIDRVDHYLKHRKPSRFNVRLIATHFATASTPTAREAQQELEGHFDIPVYLLDRAVLNRFAINSLPTVVTGNNAAKRMVVETLGPKATP